MKEGFERARATCIKLEMSPHHSSSSHEKQWWLMPWVVESEMWKDEVAALSSEHDDDRAPCLVVLPVAAPNLVTETKSDDDKQS